MAALAPPERVIRTHDAAATRELATRLAGVAAAGDVVCLWGELGAGKTQFAKGFGLGLGVTETIASPTFVLMAEYEGRLPLFHLDLYRVEDAAEALEDGLLDEREATGVTVVEWADRLGPALPASRLDVRIEGAGQAIRPIRLRSSDARHERYLAVIG